ncbi:MAG: hypothetical protein HPY69_07070 [Armatimonadetes bacterium]|nr:hypothetical protein [Armatimonadota bacterium]
MSRRPIHRRYYTPGFHSDVVWIEDQRDYAIVLMGCMAQNLQACRADPGYGVFLHELTYLKPYLDSHPVERKLVLDLIRAGRIGTGGAHSLPSTNLISGEAFLRNFAYGRAYQESLGDTPEVAMLWDVFGHCSQLPQMLTELRFAGVIWSKDIRGVHPLFWHLGPDGTRLLTRRVMYGHVTAPRKACQRYLQECLPEIAGLGHPVDLRLDCGDFKPPTAWIVGRSAELAAEPDAETGCCGVPDAPWLISGQAHRLYFREMHEAIATKRFFVPTCGRDLEWHHQGTGLTHIDLKIANRRAENVLVSAEKWCCFAEALGLPYPHRALDKAWRQVFFGQHHDAITGPCNDRSYLDLMDGYREALELGEAAQDAALACLAQATDTRGPRGSLALVVSNPCNWRRTDVVETAIVLPDGWSGLRLQDRARADVVFEVEWTEPGSALTLRFVATVPGLGQTTYWLVPGDGPLPEVQSREGVTIASDLFQVVADPRHGGLVTLYDKRLQCELLGGQEPGNELLALEEDFTGHPEPPWELNTSGKHWLSRDYKAELEVREGPVSATLIVRGKFRDCRREQHVRLYQGVGRLEFRTVLRRYQGRETIYALAFPAALPGATPVYDDRFGCVVKRRSRGHLDFRTWQWRNYSDCGARRAYQWVDLSHSAMLAITDGAATVASHALGPMSLVLTRSEPVEEAMNSLQEALVRRGVPCTVFHDDCDREQRWFLPHQDSTMPQESPDEDLPWGTAFRVIADTNDTNLLWQRLRSDLTPEQAEALGEERCREGVAVRFMRDTHVPGGWEPLPTLVVSAADERALTTALHRLARELTETGRLSLPAEADLTGTRTVLPDHGLALLNRGTPLHSLEADGTLVLMLTHAVPWARSPWGPDRLDFHLVAEHKTHEFEYALYPHAGTWREGGVAQAAYEYNNPLMVRQTDCHRGKLPPELSFCDVQGGIVTALKPTGYHLARGEAPPGPEERTYALRVYEPTGQPAELQIEWAGGLLSAQRANALEEPRTDLELHESLARASLNGFEIATCLLTPRRSRRAPLPALPDDVPLPPETERGIVPARYWLHNVGEAPLGFVPVALTLTGDVQLDTHVKHGGYTVNQLTVGVANNTPEMARGAVRLLVGDGWRVEPAMVRFSVPPRGGKEYPVTLLFETDRRDGLVRAQLDWDGQTFEDTIVVGQPPAPRWKAKLGKERVRVTVTNPGVDDLNADLYLIAPHEAWREVGPRRQVISLAAGESQAYDFPLRPSSGRDQRDLWLVVKLAYWGRVEYRPVWLP